MSSVGTDDNREEVYSLVARNKDLRSTSVFTLLVIY